MEIITEKYIQINHIINEIEELFEKAYKSNYNSDNSNILLSVNTYPLYACRRMLRYLSDNRDPGLFYAMWCVEDNKYDFQLSPIANKDHLSELFDEYIFVLSSTKDMLFNEDYVYVCISEFMRDNLKDAIETITYYIDSIKFIIKDLYINHPNYSYKFEAKYYLDKITKFVNQNKISVYVSKVIEEYLDKIDECLSGEEIITRLQTCYDKIVSNSNKDISTKEIHKYINKAYVAIEKEREYITKPWRKIDMLITKLYIELDLSDDDFIYEEEDSDLIGDYLKTIYEIIHDCYTKHDKPDDIIPIVEENQKKIMDVISKYAFLCYYEEPDDSYERWYDTFPDFNKKYLTPIKKIIKECVSLERFL